MRALFDTPNTGEPLSTFLGRSRHAHTRAELLGWFAPYSLRVALARGEVVRQRPGVYTTAGRTTDPLIRAEALMLWQPQAWVSGQLALHLFNARLPVPPHDDLVVPNGLHLRAAAHVRVRQIGPLRSESWPGGVRCATPEVALVDAWHRAAPAARLDLLYEALWERVCTPGAAWKAARAATRTSQRSDLLDVLGWFRRGATSPLEVMALRDVFVGRQFAEFEAQGLVKAGGRRARADMVHRRARVVLEFDGQRFHERSKDHHRDIDLATEDYVTLRFGWRDLREQPQWCRERVLRVVAARLATTRST